MTTIPFVCAKSGQDFLPNEGGKCCICQRLLLLHFLHTKLFSRQAMPICVDCLKDIVDLAMKKNVPPC